MGIHGEKHVVELPHSVLNEGEVVIDGEVRMVKIGNGGLMVGCHYVTDAAFKKIYELYCKVRGGDQ